MRDDKIDCQLNKLFEEICDVDFSKYSQLRKESLFSDYFQLCARDLLILLDRVQTQFRVSLRPESLQSYGFLTYEDIYQNVIMALKGGEK